MLKYIVTMLACNSIPLDSKGWRLKVTGTITNKYETRVWAVTNLKDDCDLLLSHWQNFHTTDKAWCEPAKWTKED